MEQGIDAADTNPWRYCGEYFDKETGNIYLRARYYDPVLGRFTQEDPIGDGLNWYTYCDNNPVMFADSSGLAMEPSEWLEEAIYLMSLKDIENAGNMFWSTWADITKFMSLLTKKVDERAIENYLYNKNIEVDDFVYAQGDDRYKDIKFGAGTTDANGCGWVAAYNAMRLLGHYVHPSDIILYLERNGGLLFDGKLGANPFVLNQYLLSEGFETEIHYNSLNFVSLVKKSSVSILMYLWTLIPKYGSDAKFNVGGHFVTIHHNQSELHVYNAFLKAESYNIFSSLKDWRRNLLQDEKAYEFHLDLALITFK